MNQRKEIRRKVARLRKEETKTASRIVNSLYSLMILMMCCVAVVLTNKIHAAGGFDMLAAKLSETVDALNLTQLKQWIFLEKWMNEKTLTVSSSSYHWIEGQYYEVDNHEVSAVDDGIVIFCGQQDSGKVLMVRQDNGLIVTYGLLNEVFCDTDDRIVKGTLIAKVSDEVYLDFSWQGVSMSYEEALVFEP